MARTKLNPEFEIAANGDLDLWRLHRRPGWSSDTADHHGLALAVRHHEGQREVVIEFPPGPQPRYGAP